MLQVTWIKVLDEIHLKSCSKASLLVRLYTSNLGQGPDWTDYATYLDKQSVSIVTGPVICLIRALQ